MWFCGEIRGTKQNMHSTNVWCDLSRINNFAWQTHEYWTRIRYEYAQIVHTKTYIYDFHPVYFMNIHIIRDFIWSWMFSSVFRFRSKLNQQWQWWGEKKKIGKNYQYNKVHANAHKPSQFTNGVGKHLQKP